MKDLQDALAQIGLKEVRTYIQSGNVVFASAGTSAARLAGRIGACIVDRFGFDAHPVVLSGGDLERAIAANPFPEAEHEPKSLQACRRRRATGARSTPCGTWCNARKG